MPLKDPPQAKSVGKDKQPSCPRKAQGKSETIPSEETVQYLKASEKDFSDTDFKKIYDKIGGNPAQLSLMLTKKI